MNVRALRKQQAGFTLIELVMVIAVIGILASIALMKFSSSNAASQQAVCDYNKSIGERAYARRNGDAITGTEDVELKNI